MEPAAFAAARRAWLFFMVFNVPHLDGGRNLNLINYHFNVIISEQIITYSLSRFGIITFSKEKRPTVHFKNARIYACVAPPLPFPEGTSGRDRRALPAVRRPQSEGLKA